jgi:hypothetical protein
MDFEVAVTQSNQIVEAITGGIGESGEAVADLGQSMVRRCDSRSPVEALAWLVEVDLGREAVGNQQVAYAISVEVCESRVRCLQR